MTGGTERQANVMVEVAIEAWRRALGVPDLAPDDDVFAAGGTSLAAAQVAAELTRTLGSPPVGVGDVLRSPTPRALASRAARADIGPARLVVEEAPSGTAAGPAPASVQQQAIWFMEQLNPNVPAYNSVATIGLEGPLDRSLLGRSLRLLVARHAILRSRYPTLRGRLVQVVEPQCDVVVEHQASLPEAREGLVARLARHRFDIAEARLVRWTLLEEEGRNTLVQVEHHFVHDGWSTWILLRDLAQLYRSEGESEVLPGLQPGSEYAAYSRWQERWLGSEAAQEALVGWVNLLADAPKVYRFPMDRRRPPRFTHEGGVVRMVLPAALRKRLPAAAARVPATPFSVLMASFVVLLGELTDASSLTLGTMLRNRQRAGGEHAVGMFVNTVALPFTGWRERPFEVFVREVLDHLARAHDLGQVPFPMVVRALDVSRDQSRNPLFQVSFSMNDWPNQTLDFGHGIRSEVNFPGNGLAKFDLDVVLLDSATGCFLWSYYAPLFERAEVVALARRYQSVLERNVAHLLADDTA